MKWQRGRKPPTRLQGPPVADVEAAVAQLRAPDALCFVHLTTTNQGLSAELSFNTATSETHSGRLEIALREAAIEVASPLVDPQWTWNDSLLETARGSMSMVEVLSSATEGTAARTDDGTEASVSGMAQVAALVAKGEVNSKIQERRSSQTERSASRGVQSKVTRMQRHIRVERRSGAFRLEFFAGTNDDLVDLNTELTRLPLIDVPAPGDLDLQAVTLDLHLSFAEESSGVRHAFHIRRATGMWSQLSDHANRRILAEILISKFLPEIHAAQRLWPKAGQS